MIKFVFYITLSLSIVCVHAKEFIGYISLSEYSIEYHQFRKVNYIQKRFQIESEQNITVYIYSQDSMLLISGRIEGGVPVKEWKYYYSSGTLSLVDDHSCCADLYKTVSYSESSRKIQSISFRNKKTGLLDSVRKEFYDNGKVKSNTHYLEGKSCGLNEQYDSLGVLRYSCINCCSIIPEIKCNCIEYLNGNDILNYNLPNTWYSNGVIKQKFVFDYDHRKANYLYYNIEGEVEKNIIYEWRYDEFEKITFYFPVNDR